MCSLILKPADPNKPKNRVFRAINRWLDVGNHHYIAEIRRVIRHPKRVISFFGIVLVFIFTLYRLIRPASSRQKTRDISQSSWNFRKEQP